LFFSSPAARRTRTRTRRSAAEDFFLEFPESSLYTKSVLELLELTKVLNVFCKKKKKRIS
jgi:hypothetical protein